MDGLTAWALANGYTDEVGSGISALNSTPTGFELVTTSGITLSFTIPNLHIHNNLNDILEKLSLDTNNKLLFDGQPIKESIDLTNYVQKEIGKGLFSGNYNDLLNRPVTQQPNKSISFTSSDWVQDSIELDKYNLEITHGLKTIDVVCSIYNSAGDEETLGVDIISSDRIILTAYSAPISGRIVISYASTTGTNTGIQDLNNFTSDNLAEGVTNKYVSATGKSIVESINLTSPTEKQVLSFDSTGKIINETIYDEKVKMSASDTNAQYLSDLLDGVTVQNVNGKIVVKNVDGVTVGVSNINTLSGMTDNIKAKFDALSNAMKFTGTVPTKADLDVVVGMISGDVKIVLSDETNLNKKITYVYDGSAWHSLGEFTIQVRDFSTNPIQLSNTGIEITGILDQSHINMNGILKTTDIIDDLVHTDVNKPSSANQAKILKGLIDGKTQVNDNGVAGNITETYSIDKIIKLLNDKQNKIYTQSTQPSSPTLNTIWIDTTNSTNYSIKCYNGTGFVQVGSSGGITIENWSSLTSYNSNSSFVIYNSNLYRCKTTHISTMIFETANWDLVGGDVTKTYLETIIDKIYPVGHILMTENSANPNTYLGIGTWVAYGAGKVPVGIDSSQTEFNTIGQTGGEKTHKLTITEMPSHTHSYVDRGNTAFNRGDWGSLTDTADNTTGNYTTGSTGSDGSHNNLQPYVVCYMWKRTI